MVVSTTGLPRPPPPSSIIGVGMVVSTTGLPRPPPLLYNWSGYGCVYRWTTPPPPL